MRLTWPRWSRRRYFHVNGDDPEACVRVARLALDFRQDFHKDVVIDMVCYRRYGHNEQDDPSLTQPLLYQLIKDHRSVRKLYTEALVRRGDITLEEAEAALADFSRRLQAALDETRASAPPQLTSLPPAPSAPAGVRAGEYRSGHGARWRPSWMPSPRHPMGCTLHPKIARLLEARSKLWASGQVDWALGEALAYGTIVLDGRDVRLCGQDTRRGTFGHRNAVYVDYRTGAEHIPLADMAQPPRGRRRPVLCLRFAPVGICGSRFRVRLLAVLARRAGGLGSTVRRFRERRADNHRPVPGGFRSEVGTAFAPGATASPWLRRAGPRAFLRPGGTFLGTVRRRQHVRGKCHHGGTAFPSVAPAGPPSRQEAARAVHPQALPSGARGLQPGRRANRRRFPRGDRRRPLPAPKESAGSSLPPAKSPSTCSWRATRRKGTSDVAVVRVEQLYPWPDEQLAAVLSRYAQATEVVWAQEEPANMGAWDLLHETAGLRT